ncbi:hypothetical protein PSTT_09316 [Puccinia striiformis]|uniref:Uncharacterized protein n=1 Tax=Puccinia striiformis TaxID=27350 RepID=A0A2S4V992_9BASI|nr:hypothetical protein PSTT_09316 [Puccinia striiformis]
MYGQTSVFETKLACAVASRSYPIPSTRSGPKPRMFLQTSALVVYGALLALVTTTKASQPKGRFTKRFFSAAKDAGGAREKGIFTTSYMNQFTPLPGESGLSLMEFHASHRVLGVDSNDMDRFVNAVASDNMEEATTTKRFKIEDLYEKHLYYLEHHRNQFPFLSSMEFDQVSKQLRDLVLDHPTGSLEDYFSLINTYKPGINEEATRFISWKLLKLIVWLISISHTFCFIDLQCNFRGKEWRNKYKDTVKIRIADLLDSYMEWAWKDSKLKENLWVRSWIEGNEEFVLDALGERLMKLYKELTMVALEKDCWGDKRFVEENDQSFS